jgi:hypothetical protein
MDGTDDKGRQQVWMDGWNEKMVQAGSFVLKVLRYVTDTDRQATSNSVRVETPVITGTEAP